MELPWYVLGYVVLAWFIIDPVILTIINLLFHRGGGGCSKDTWWSLSVLTPINSYMLRDVTCGASDSSCKDLGRWKTYKTRNNNNNYLCSDEIDGLYKDIVENNVVGGYNLTELLAYVWIPSMVVAGIGWGLISTTLSKAEWTFWILIATVIFTSIRSLSYDSDLSILPEQSSPLSYVSDKLELEGTDELKYSFIARKQDGKECFVEGTMLGGGVVPENQPPSYSGYCTAETLPLY